MAILIKSDGSLQRVSPKNNTNFTLKELQKYVGGYIEVIKVRRNSLMKRLWEQQIAVVNEEGKLKNLPYNSKATHLAGFTRLVGDVLFCKNEEAE